MEKILVTGACGHLGSELTAELRSLYGQESVIASDIAGADAMAGSGPYERVDVADYARVKEISVKYGITSIYHLAALLSARAEQAVRPAWKLNVEGLLNILDVARELSLEKIFWPSSIAVFGPDAPAEGTPQNSPVNPQTVYGISKLAGEQWCSYYHREFGLDIRSLRYPGLVGYKSLPGGGTTDYAVEIFHKALRGEPYSCFLERGTRLPMMHMKDAVKAALDLMKADPGRITVRTSYNIASVSFSPEELAGEIRIRIPGLRITYKPDNRQKIASSWPDSIDDSVARRDWGWKPEYDLRKMTDDIISHLPEYWDIEQPEEPASRQ